MVCERREASACLIMLSAKQGSHWYHFYNVFDMTRPGIDPTPILTYRTRSGRSTTWAIAALLGVTWSYLPLSVKRKIHIRLCPEDNLCNYFPMLWNLQINRAGIKYLTSWKLGHVALFTLELHALDCWHIVSQMSNLCPLGNLYVSFVLSSTVIT